MRKFLRLPAAERLLLVKAFLVVGTARAGLWILPFRTLSACFERASRPSSSDRLIPLPPPARVSWAIAAASRCIPKATCLTQSLAARLLLARMGYPATLQIGAARRKDGKLEAHAWVEIRGEPVAGALEDLSRFSKFRSFRVKPQEL